MVRRHGAGARPLASAADAGKNCARMIGHRKKPTIDDVAKHSGVARVTVSRVINDGPNVRAEIRQRVQASILALGYQVNVQARNLAAGSARQILLFYEWNSDAEPNSYYHAGLELGALTACAQHGYELSTLHVSSLMADWRGHVVAQIESRRANGCILTPPFADDSRLIAAIMASSCPLVCISSGGGAAESVPSIGIDDEQAGYDMARFLLDLGHRQIAYLKGLAEHLSAEKRYNGFCRAVRDFGVDPEQCTAVRGNFTFRSGVDCCDEVLDCSPGITAIICGNDDMAAGALLACHRRGIDIPRDISVVGFDNSPVSDIVWPPLTTVSQPIKDIAQRAVLRLIDCIDGREDGQGALGDVVEHRIVERQSSAPPPASRPTAALQGAVQR